VKLLVENIDNKLHSFVNATIYGNNDEVKYVLLTPANLVLKQVEKLLDKKCFFCDLSTDNDGVEDEIKNDKDNNIIDFNGEIKDNNDDNNDITNDNNINNNNNIKDSNNDYIKDNILVTSNIIN
jgi:hypothetical protein